MLSTNSIEYPHVNFLLNNWAFHLWIYHYYNKRKNGILEIKYLWCCNKHTVFGLTSGSMILSLMTSQSNVRIVVIITWIATSKDILIFEFTINIKQNYWKITGKFTRTVGFRWWRWEHCTISGCTVHRERIDAGHSRQTTGWKMAGSGHQSEDTKLNNLSEIRTW